LKPLLKPNFAYERWDLTVGLARWPQLWRVLDAISMHTTSFVGQTKVIADPAEIK
jgi:hypothetical protein